MNIGEFYGYSVYQHKQEDNSRTGSSSETEYPPFMTNIHLKEHLTLLQRHEKEVQCHYSIACSQLEELLNSSSNSSPGSCFGNTLTSTARGDERKVHTIYQQCINLQLQLNFAQRAIQQMVSYLNFSGPDANEKDSKSLTQASQDSLRFVSQCLLETLLTMIAKKPQDILLSNVSNSPEPNIWSTCVSQPVCEALFRNFCVNGTPELRIRTAAFLHQACCSKPWWGDFLVQRLQEFFCASQDNIFPKER